MNSLKTENKLSDSYKKGRLIQTRNNLRQIDYDNVLLISKPCEREQITSIMEEY